MIVMMHFGSWANCSITTGYEPFPSLFSRLCFWSKCSDQDSNPELPLKKKIKYSPSSSGSTHGLKLYVLSKVSIWMLKLCSIQGGEVKTAKIFDGIFLKGLSFAWEGWRKKNTFWKVDWIVADLQDVICSRKEKEKETGIFIQSWSVCNQYTLF